MNTLDKPQTSTQEYLPPNEDVRSKGQQFPIDGNLSLPQRIKHLALQALAYLGMSVGALHALWGGCVQSSWVVIPSSHWSIRAGDFLLETTRDLMSQPWTSLGAFVTLPAAFICYAIPFVPSFAIGALPGILIVALSSRLQRWNLKKENGEAIAS